MSESNTSLKTTKCNETGSENLNSSHRVRTNIKENNVRDSFEMADFENSSRSDF